MEGRPNAVFGQAVRLVGQPFFDFAERTRGANDVGDRHAQGPRRRHEGVWLLIGKQRDQRIRPAISLFSERYTSQTLWQRTGRPAEAAHDGTETLEAVRRFRPDVVFCDLNLQDTMHGYEVCRRLKPGGGRLLAISLTGYNEADVAEKARDGGFDEVAGKLRDAEAPEEIAKRLRDGKAAKSGIERRNAGSVSAERPPTPRKRASGGRPFPPKKTLPGIPRLDQRPDAIPDPAEENRHADGRTRRF